METTRTAERRELRAIYISFGDQTCPAEPETRPDPDWLGAIKTGVPSGRLIRSIPRSTQAFMPVPDALFDAGERFKGAKSVGFPPA